MSPAETYTHGHHDSVLRSHRWRTAANSAAYLLPHLTSGQRLLDIGCGPGTITLDLARLVAPGQTVGLDREVTPLVAARAAAIEQGVHNAASPSATSTSWTSRTTASTSCTRIRCCSTSPIRLRRFGRWAGSAGPAVISPSGTRTTRP